MNDFQWPDDGRICTVPSIGEAAQGTRQRSLELAAAEAKAKDCPRVLDLLDSLAEVLMTFDDQKPPHRVDLSDFNPDECALMDQVLGEGEVRASVTMDHLSGVICESVLVGLWRLDITRSADGKTTRSIEIAAVPSLIAEAAATGKATLPIGTPPDGAMNVLPVLHELGERAGSHKPGQANHVVNLTLLPMNEADKEFLQESLGTGPLMIRSKGYGTCHITRTRVRNVWSVQYLNVMGDVILDTIEVGDIPVAARATREDFEDSAERLRDIREVYL